MLKRKLQKQLHTLFLPGHVGNTMLDIVTLLNCGKAPELENCANTGLTQHEDMHRQCHHFATVAFHSSMALGLPATN